MVTIAGETEFAGTVHVAVLELILTAPPGAEPVAEKVFPEPNVCDPPVGE